MTAEPQAWLDDWLSTEIPDVYLTPGVQAWLDQVRADPPPLFSPVSTVKLDHQVDLVHLWLDHQMTLDPGRVLEWLGSLGSLNLTSENLVSLTWPSRGDCLPQVDVSPSAQRSGRTRRRRPSDGTTTLYRIWDAEGRLLYVGIAGNPGRRFHEHSKTKTWWGQVAGVTTEHFPTRISALAAEAAAIRAESPLHNIQGAAKMTSQSTEGR